MINNQGDFLSEINIIFQECLELVKRKNSDYSGESDPFQNIKSSTFVGVKPELAILVRMMDKLSRVSTLLADNSVNVPQVTDEKIEDTLKDIINYSAILLTFLKEKRKWTEKRF